MNRMLIRDVIKGRIVGKRAKRAVDIIRAYEQMPTYFEQRDMNNQHEGMNNNVTRL
jgi:hypothetical protein